MATVEDVARSVLATISSSASITIASQWVRDRFRQAASRSRLRAMRKVGTLSIPAPYTTGTISVNTGSTLVTGDGTAWSKAMEERWLRIETVWYEIAEVNSTTSLTLSTPIVEDTDSGLGYEIRERYTALPADVAYIGSVIHMPTRTLVTRVGLLELDQREADRRKTGNAPCFMAEVSFGAGNTRRYEFYPYVNEATVLHFAYWQVPPALGMHDEIPFGIDPWTLREGAMIDLYRYEMGKAIAAGNQQAAELYRNEMRAQKTQWDTKEIHELVRSDGGSEDIVFIAEQLGMEPFEITTAEQHVWMA